MTYFYRVASFALVVAVLGGCSKPAPDAAPEATAAPGTVNRPAVSVKYAIVQHRSLSGTITANGEVIPGAGAQANLTFPTAGLIASVGVAVGDRVSRGEVLAHLDDRLANRDVAQGVADVNAASAQLAKARAGARPQEVAQNRALVVGIEAKVRTSRAELQRQQSLASVGIAARRDVEAAQASYADAVAQLHDKQQAGSLLIAGPRYQDVDVARAQLAQSQASLATAQTRASLLTLTAPFDGVVTARLKGPGEVVDTTASVLTIVDPSKAMVAVRLSEDQANAVKPGDPTEVSINGSQTLVAGTISTVNASLDAATRTLQAYITPVGTFRLRPGATASARITVRTIADAYVVPVGAIVKDPETGTPLVFAPIAGGAFRRIAIRIALQSHGYAAVQAAQLRTVSRVVTDGAYELLPYAVSSDKG